MNLLDDSIYVVVAVLAVAGLGGGAWLTSRTPRNLRGAALNGLVILVSSVLILAGVGLVLNRSNAWFEKPSDILGGAESKEEHQQKGAASDTFVREDAVTRTDTRALPALPAPGQRTQVFNVPTSVGNATWAVTVILPSGYFEPGEAQRAYPVLMAGHGMPGSTRQFQSVIDMATVGDQAVSQRKIAPFITVVPSLMPNGKDTECVHGPGGDTQVETWLARDVPAFVAERLRVVPQRSGWAWLGFSAGAWCGSMVTMRHPDRFSAAVSLGGYFRPAWTSKPPLNAQQLAGYDLVALAKTKPPRVALSVHSTRKDASSWASTKPFLESARAPMSVTAAIDSAGGHNFSVWRPQVPKGLAWLGAGVPGFKP